MQKEGVKCYQSPPPSQKKGFSKAFISFIKGSIHGVSTKFHRKDVDMILGINGSRKKVFPESTYKLHT